MDLVKLQKKAILIPTPGQPEQEYLAKFLMRQNIFLCVSQQEFSLNEAVKKAVTFSFKEITVEYNTYETAIKDFVKKYL
jgi:hypothetical protein